MADPPWRFSCGGLEGNSRQWAPVSWPAHEPRRRLSCVERLGLTWVVVEGRPRCVSDFAGLAPRDRPPAICPVCQRRLTLKLGRVRRHHAAHAPTAVCAATQPETALHVDTKLYLATQLRTAIGTGAELVVRQGCGGAPGESCNEVHDEPWLREWDEVAVETLVVAADARRRPDIVLRRAGQAIGAIEVCVTHAVSDDKSAALAHLGVPWIEIRAHESLLDPEHGWRIGTALPAARIGPGETHDGWRCQRHERRETRLCAARVVDVYRAGGDHERLIYRVDELRVEGVTRALTMRRHGRDIATARCDWSLKSQRAAWPALMKTFHADLRTLTESPGAFADSPMRWARGDVAENLVHEALADIQPGDPTPLATRYPRRWFFARERGHWFLPGDMRSVRWDRPLLDAFAAHPAWTASRAVVRERPVPDDSWSSFVFASRPVGALFGTGRRVTQNGLMTILELDAAVPDLPERALVILSGAADDVQVRDVARALDEAGVEHLWLSHPLDWHSGRSDLAWATAGRDSRGRAVVLIDGLGIYRAETFARSFERRNPRVHPDAVKRRMADRVARLDRGSGKATADGMRVPP